MEAQRVSRRIALLFLQPLHYMGVGGQSHSPANLPPEQATLYRLYRRLGGLRDGLAVCGKSRLLRDMMPRPSSP